MLFGRKSWSRSLPSLGAHTSASAASAARVTPRPSTPSPAFLSHCLRSKLIDPPLFIDPPDRSSTPHPIPPHVGGGERCPTYGAAIHSAPPPILPHVGEGNAVPRMAPRFQRG